MGEMDPNEKPSPLKGRGQGEGWEHQTSQPPSTVTDWPVMFFESSETR